MKAGQAEQLYNIELDVGEQKNIVEQNPEMAQHMRDMLNKILTAESMNAFE
jgi:hypothetical protein